MADTDVFGNSDEDIEISPKKKCNWCNMTVKLLSGKPYCNKCSRQCFKECRRCHRPFPHERYFELDENRCNACQKKYLKEREKRQQTKQKKEDGTEKSKNIDTSSDEDSSGPPPSKIARKVPPNMKKQLYFIPLYKMTPTTE